MTTELMELIQVLEEDVQANRGWLPEEQYTPSIWHVVRLRGEYTLVPFPVPERIWTDLNPQDGFGFLAWLFERPDQQENFCRLMPSEIVGIIVETEGWSLRMPVDPDKSWEENREKPEVRQALEDGARHRIHTRPDRVECRVVQGMLLTETGLYGVLRYRDTDEQQTFDDGFEGAISEAIVRIANAMRVIQMEQRARG
jgi:hypothetical protein